MSGSMPGFSGADAVTTDGAGAPSIGTCCHFIGLPKYAHRAPGPGGIVGEVVSNTHSGSRLR